MRWHVFAWALVFVVAIMFVALALQNLFLRGAL